MILEDDNILFENVKQSVNFLDTVKDIFKLYMCHRDLDINETCELIKKLPKFENFEWRLYGSTGADILYLINKDLISVCAIRCECHKHQFKDLFDIEYEYKFQITLTDINNSTHQYTELKHKLISLFELRDRRYWYLNCIRDRHYNCQEVYTFKYDIL